MFDKWNGWLTFFEGVACLAFKETTPKELLFFMDQQKKFCKPVQGFWLLSIPLSIKTGGDCLLLAFYEGRVDHRESKKLSFLSSFCFFAAFLETRKKAERKGKAFALLFCIVKESVFMA